MHIILNASNEHEKNYEENMIKWKKNHLSHQSMIASRF